MQTRNRSLCLALAFGAPAALAGCGGSSTSSTLPPGYYITISSLSYAPLNLRVPSGATVTVLNRDAMAHSVTSQAAPGQYVLGAPAGVTTFDTGNFTGSATFVVPSGLADGTTLSYFCKTHTSTMTTPNGTLTISATAPPASPPAGSGTAGGY